MYKIFISKKELEFMKDQFYKSPLVMNLKNIIYSEQNINKNYENLLKFYDEVLKKAFIIYEKNDEKNIDYLLSTYKCLKNDENSIYVRRKKFLKVLKSEMEVIKNYFKF